MVDGIVVATGGLRHAAVGVHAVGDALATVHVDSLIAALPHAVAGGRIEAVAPDVVTRWRALLQAALADVEATAHAYVSGAALYEAVEHNLAQRALATGREWLSVLTHGGAR